MRVRHLEYIKSLLPFVVNSTEYRLVYIRISSRRIYTVRFHLLIRNRSLRVNFDKISVTNLYKFILFLIVSNTPLTVGQPFDWDVTY